MILNSQATEDQAKAVRKELLKEDMLSKYGIRSTSSQDARYNNVDEIKPYSNWEGSVFLAPLLCFLSPLFLSFAAAFSLLPHVEG